VVAGCYWLRYDALARTHVEVLSVMLGKLEDLTRRDGMAPPAMAEYRYPLVRARDFIRIVEGRFAGRASLAALRALCDAYEAALEAVPVVRGDLDAFSAAAAAARARAAAVVAVLDAEAA
jgi:hypothetical protein